MHHVKRSVIPVWTRGCCFYKSHSRFCNPPSISLSDAALASSSSTTTTTNATDGAVIANSAKALRAILNSSSVKQYSADSKHNAKGVLGVNGNYYLGTPVLLRGWRAKEGAIYLQSQFQLTEKFGVKTMIPFSRAFASRPSKEQGQNQSKDRKDLSTVEDPFDSPTYNIPEKPVTFTEGASYSVVILAGLGIAAAAGYAVFKELIFEPKEYKIFDKALKRIQDDGQVRVRIGSPITGYGQESRNRAARQRIPNRVWTDEDGIERVEVNFYIRGPHGAGKVYAEMFKDKVDKQWKFTYLIVEIRSPSPAQLMLESYVPA